MKILDTDICMSSSRTYLEKDDEQERMRFWIDRAPARNASGPDRVTISSMLFHVFRSAGAGGKKMR